MYRIYNVQKDENRNDIRFVMEELMVEDTGETYGRRSKEVVISKENVRKILAFAMEEDMNDRIDPSKYAGTDTDTVTNNDYNKRYF